MTDAQVLTFRRQIAASPTRIAACLTDAEHRAIWGPPGPDQVVLIENQPEPVPGGREQSRCGPADNPYVDVTTDWICREPERIIYVETLAAEGTMLGTTLATYDLEADGEGTALTVTLCLQSFIGAEMFSEFEAGWTHAMDNFVAYAAAKPQ